MSGFSIAYRDAVIEKDLPAIPRNLRQRISLAIEHRLVNEPARHGERLRKSLLGLWRIRVGDYRVAYTIEGATGRIWAIVHRKEAYEEVARRWRRAATEHS